MSRYQLTLLSRRHIDLDVKRPNADLLARATALRGLVVAATSLRRGTPSSALQHGSPSDADYLRERGYPWRRTDHDTTFVKNP